MSLPHGHHCTISFIDKRRDDKLIDAAREFYKIFNRERKSLCVTAIGIDKFAGGKIDVVLLEFNSTSFWKVYQKISQVGTQEDPTPVRIPHMSYWLDGDKDKVAWLEALVQSIK